MKNIKNNDDFILTRELIIQKLKELKSIYLKEGFEIGLCSEIERLRYYFYFDFGETKPVEIEEIDDDDLL